MNATKKAQLQDLQADNRELMAKLRAVEAERDAALAALAEARRAMFDSLNLIHLAWTDNESVAHDATSLTISTDAHTKRIRDNLEKAHAAIQKQVRRIDALAAQEPRG